MPKIRYIDNVNDPILNDYRNLKVSQNELSGTFIAETRTVILNALDCGCIPLSFLMEEKFIDARDSDIISRFPDAVVYTGTHEMLTSLTGFPLTRGILSLMKRPAEKSFTDIVCEKKRIAVLSNIQDASNIGTILRSAAALGMDGVLLTDDCCDPFHRKAIRTSTGGVFRLPWAKLKLNGSDTAIALKKLGFQTAALALNDSSVTLGAENKIDRSLPLALFLGSEGNGLDEETISECDFTLKIPMRHGSDSLNVAAAAAIAFYEYSL